MIVACKSLVPCYVHYHHDAVCVVTFRQLPQLMMFASLFFYLYRSAMTSLTAQRVAASSVKTDGFTK